MQQHLRRAITLTALGCLLMACDTVRDQTAVIDYVPATNPVVLQGAQALNLSVAAVDKRTSLRDRLSIKKGLAGAVVYPGNDIIELVRTAVEREFRGQGFVIAAGGFTITVEVQNFYNDFRANAALFMSSIADVALTVRVKDANGITLYTHGYNGVAQVGPVFNESAETAKTVLEQALASAIGQIVEDKALQAALLVGKSKSPATLSRLGRAA